VLDDPSVESALAGRLTEIRKQVDRIADKARGMRQKWDRETKLTPCPPPPAQTLNQP
jgi:hypothetical protein